MIKTIKKLSDSVIRKFIEVITLKNWQIMSDQGWSDIDSINKTVPFQKYIIKTEKGKELHCADNHILIDKDYNEIFAKDSLNVYIKTIDGNELVTEVIATDIWENMYDFSLNKDSNHLYYGSGILSHNSTLMTIVAIWTALFFPDQTIVIIANKQSTATEIFNRARLAFLEMDNWIKGGIVEFNKTFFTLSNGSRILTSATSADAIRGLTIDVLLLDEFAIIPPKIAAEFWAAVTPALATRFSNNKNAKLIVSSTPKGVGNKFHELVSKSKQNKNDFKVEEAMWYDFPGRDEAWKKAEMSTLGYDMFTQEYECQFLNNSGSPFEPSMFDKFDSEMKEPINILEEGNYLIWEKPDPNRIYVMGVDTSEGTGQDFSVIQIFDITDLSEIVQVARYSTNRMDTTSWASKVYEIAKQWYSPIVLIERNGPGTTPCDKFFNEWNYPRFLNYGTSVSGSLRTDRRFQPGIISQLYLKGIAVGNMKYYIHDKRCVKLYDKETITELRTFARRKTPSGNYKWCAQSGFHDDHVMAMAWALFILHERVINTWLIVKEKNTDGTPLKIDRRWTFNPQQDFSDSLYKKMENNSPFIGVIAMKGQGREELLRDPRILNKLSKGEEIDRMSYLLNCGEMVSLEDIRNRTVFPGSFNQCIVKAFPQW